jgi:hemerythrin-like domain-containing protein
MDVVQLIRREHAKTSAIFEKLADTSDNALKTRGRLFDQLKYGLEAHDRAVKDVVYPILLQHPETQDLLPQLRGQDERAQMIDELEQTPKDHEDFLAKLKELRKRVEQSMKAEERQIFPAIKKVVGDDKAQELARQIAAEMREEIERAQERAEDPVLSAADTATAAARSAAVAGPQQFAEIGAQVLRAANTFLQSNRRAADDLQVLLTAPAATAEANMQGVQELSRCSSVQQVAELQGGLMRNNLHGWLEGTAEALRITRRISSDALATLEERIGPTQ